MEEIIVSEGLRRRLVRILERCPAPEDDLEAFLAHALASVGSWPRSDLARILKFRANPMAPSVLLIRGMPVDERLPPTPVSSLVEARERTPVGEGAILSIAAILGEPVGYIDEKDGAVVQHVFPLASEANSSSNESSAAGLDFHTELSFSRRHPEWPMDHACPDFLLILCLRADPMRQANTSILEARTICERLPERHLRILREPNFELRAPYSFTRGGDRSRPWSDRVSLVSGPDWAPRIAFDLACGLRGTSSQADDAIDALREVSRSPGATVSVRLDRGDLLVLNNRTCAHARDPFEARFDGRDRWLLRSYVRRSIEGLADAPSLCWRVL